MLTISNLTVQKNNRNIFKNFSITLIPGCCLVVRGVNGSGKTTLVKTIAGLINPHHGEILMDEKPIIINELHEIVNYIGHKNGIKQELTVEENLKFYAMEHDSTPTLMASVMYFGLEPYMETPVYQLSEGWKRRVALTRLMINQAPLWLLDEPTSNLDEEAVRLLINLITIRCNQDGIVIVTSHQNLPIPHAQELMIEDYAEST